MQQQALDDFQQVKRIVRVTQVAEPLRQVRRRHLLKSVVLIAPEWGITRARARIQDVLMAPVSVVVEWVTFIETVQTAHRHLLQIRTLKTTKKKKIGSETAVKTEALTF